MDEAFAAGVAAKRPLPGVCALVALQRVRLVEAFATSVTSERLLPRVYAQVTLQVSVDGKAFVAVLARVRPFSGVDLLVHFQAVSPVKTFPALLTVKWADVCVETLMVPQQLLQSEAFPTDVTHVGPDT